jgi:hypothetical protein
MISAVCHADEPLSPATFVKWRDYIRPSDQEVEYLKIPWRTNFAAALSEARKKDQPIFLWSFHGHPLGCSCINGVHTKEIFENQEVKELTKAFLPVAEDSGRLQYEKTFPAYDLFKRENTESSTTQGFYVFTPSGKLLGRSWYKPEEVINLLRESSRKWDQIPKAERDAMAKGVNSKKEEDALYPKDGFVLHSYLRDLPRKVGKPRKEWNQEFTWFQKNEARQFVPLKVKVGEQHDVPKLIVHRLARFTFIDSVIGGTLPFDDQHVKTARLNARIVSLKGGVAHLEFDGNTFVEEVGEWSVHHDGKDRGPQKRGCDFKIIGNADFNVSRQSFTSFELVACGNRWGGTQFNWRDADTAVAPIGVVCFMASKEPWEKVRPLHLERYWPMSKR